MNATTRNKMVREVLRIANVVQMGRGELEDRVRQHKEDIDAILRRVAPHTIAGNKLRRRPKTWSDLRPQDRQRIATKLARKLIAKDYDDYHLDGIVNARLLRMGLIDIKGAADEVLKTKTALSLRSGSSWQPRRGWSTPDNRRRRLPAKGTPTSRLHDKRLALVNGLRTSASYDFRYDMEGLEFVPSLHPDDAEWETRLNAEDVHYYKVVCAREIMALNKLLRQHRPIAATLYLEDDRTKSRVYYGAFLDFPRKGPISVERAYVGLSVLPQGGNRPDIQQTTPVLYKTPVGALKAANDTFGKHMASLIYREGKQ